MWVCAIRGICIAVMDGDLLHIVQSMMKVSDIHPVNNFSVARRHHETVSCCNALIQATLVMETCQFSKSGLWRYATRRRWRGA